MTIGIWLRGTLTGTCHFFRELEAGLQFWYEIFKVSSSSCHAILLTIPALINVQVHESSEKRNLQITHLNHLDKVFQLYSCKAHTASIQKSGHFSRSKVIYILLILYELFFLSFLLGFPVHKLYVYITDVSNQINIGCVDRGSEQKKKSQPCLPRTLRTF
jgi:hypothetical protein